MRVACVVIVGFWFLAGLEAAAQEIRGVLGGPATEKQTVVAEALLRGSQALESNDLGTAESEFAAAQTAASSDPALSIHREVSAALLLEVRSELHRPGIRKDEVSAAFEALAHNGSANPKVICGSLLMIAGRRGVVGDLDGAKDFLGKATNYAVEHGDVETRTQVLNELIANEMDDLAEPLAASLVDGMRENDPRAYRSLRWLLAERDAARGSAEAALRQLELAANSVEDQLRSGRGTIGPHEDFRILRDHVVAIQAGLAPSDQSLAETAVALLLRLEAVRSIVLKRGELVDASGGRVPLLRELALSRRRLNDELQVCSALVDTRCDAQLEELKQETEQLSSRLRSVALPAASESPEGLLSWAELREAIPNDSALIVLSVNASMKAEKAGRFEIDEPHAFAYVVPGGQGPVSMFDLGPASAVDKIEKELRAALSDPDSDPRSVIRTASHDLAGPLLGAAQGRVRLLILPVAGFPILPFDLLEDQDGKPLIDRLRISFLNQAGDLTSSRSPKWWESWWPRRTWIVSGPMDGLSEAANEVEAIAALIPGARVLRDGEANPAAVLSIPSPAVLHVVAHGFYDGGAPPPPPVSSILDPSVASLEEFEANKTRLLQRLLMLGQGMLNWFQLLGLEPLALSGVELFARPGDPAERGILTALELAQMDLSQTELVTISSCSSGLRIPVPGPAGLRDAIALAGARSSVLSLWDVNDAATASMMIKFYGGLREGVDAAEALRQAKLAVRAQQETSHPFYWAAFFLSGKSGPIRLNPDKGRTVALVVGVLVLAIAGARGWLILRRGGGKRRADTE